MRFWLQESSRLIAKASLSVMILKSAFLNSLFITRLLCPRTGPYVYRTDWISANQISEFFQYSNQHAIILFINWMPDPYKLQSPRHWKCPETSLTIIFNDSCGKSLSSGSLSIHDFFANSQTFF